MMKKEYIKPQVETLTTVLDSQILEGSYLYHGDAKEENFTDDNLFNTDTRNIWAEEVEEE
jgi:hypothetical protein